MAPRVRDGSGRPATERERACEGEQRGWSGQPDPRSGTLKLVGEREAGGTPWLREGEREREREGERERVREGEGERAAQPTE